MTIAAFVACPRRAVPAQALGAGAARPEPKQIASGAHGPVLACRRMIDADIEAAVELLRIGFPERSATYWRQALDRLRVRSVPDTCPRFGYVMTDRSRLVGIVLVIFSIADQGGLRGNVSSWYVDPAYRGYSHMLLAAPLRLKETTLFNISPAPQTLGTIGAQGFVQYVEGTFIAFPATAPRGDHVGLRRVTAQDDSGTSILSEHAAWGCLSLEVTHAGRTYPFIFVKRRFLRGFAPCAQLAYCRDLEDFRRFARPLGRYLLRYGLGAVLVDANGPIAGIPGIYRRGHSPKFYKGPAAPRHGDLSYTELTIFGS